MECTISELHKAVKTGNTDAVSALLNQGVDVNSREVDLYASTPLHKAIEHGNIKMVQLLLVSGADVNLINNYAETALQLALERSNVEIAKVLVYAGADLNTVSRGETSLHLAAEFKDVQLVEFLLSRGADVNVTDHNGWTPLYTAVDFNVGYSHYDVIVTLLKKGADVNAQVVNGSTAFLQLIKKKAPFEIIDMFLDYGVDVNLKDNEGETSLFYAIRAENIEVVILLVDNGADVNSDNIRGSTILHEFCNSIELDEAKYFLRKGADPNACDSQGRTPLLCMLRDTKTFNDVIKFFLEHTDVNKIDLEGNNVLNITKNISDQRIVLEHIAKLQALDVQIKPSILVTISSSTLLSIYFKSCTKELEAIKSTKIKNCWVTFFNLLVDDKRKLKNYAGNKKLIQNFRSSGCIHKFPIYGASMKENLEKGIRRRKKFDKAIRELSNNLPIFNPTHLIIWDIVEHVMRLRQ